MTSVPKLRLLIEIEADQTGKNTKLTTQAWVPNPAYQSNLAADNSKELQIHNSVNIFDKNKDQELENILAQTADILHASLKLHGDKLGN